MSKIRESSDNNKKLIELIKKKRSSNRVFLSSRPHKKRIEIRKDTLNKIGRERNPHGFYFEKLFNLFVAKIPVNLELKMRHDSPMDAVSKMKMKKDKIKETHIKDVNIEDIELPYIRNKKLFNTCVSVKSSTYIKGDKPNTKIANGNYVNWLDDVYLTRGKADIYQVLMILKDVDRKEGKKQVIKQRTKEEIAKQGKMKQKTPFHRKGYKKILEEIKKNKVENEPSIIRLINKLKIDKGNQKIKKEILLIIEEKTGKGRETIDKDIENIFILDIKKIRNIIHILNDKFEEKINNDEIKPEENKITQDNINNIKKLMNEEGYKGLQAFKYVKDRLETKEKRKNIEKYIKSTYLDKIIENDLKNMIDITDDNFKFSIDLNKFHENEKNFLNNVKEPDMIKRYYDDFTMKKRRKRIKGIIKEVWKKDEQTYLNIKSNIDDAEITIMKQYNIGDRNIPELFGVPFIFKKYQPSKSLEVRAEEYKKIFNNLKVIKEYETLEKSKKILEELPTFQEITDVLDIENVITREQNKNIKLNITNEDNKDKTEIIVNDGDVDLGTIVRDVNINTLTTNEPLTNNELGIILEQIKTNINIINENKTDDEYFKSILNYPERYLKGHNIIEIKEEDIVNEVNRYKRENRIEGDMNRKQRNNFIEQLKPVIKEKSRIEKDEDLILDVLRIHKRETPILINEYSHQDDITFKDNYDINMNSNIDDKDKKRLQAENDKRFNNEEPEVMDIINDDDEQTEDSNIERIKNMFNELELEQGLEEINNNNNNNNDSESSSLESVYI